MRRLPLLALALLLSACDAGHREAPGSDNAQNGPAVRILAPYEGQTIVRPRAKGPVQALFDLTGATLGRGAGSTLRYRLDRKAKDGAKDVEGEWVTVADAAQAVPLGELAPNDEATPAYVLRAEVLKPDGSPWAGLASAAAMRTFTVHAAWLAAAPR